MDVVKRALKQQLPAYLKALPLPDTFAGFAELKPQQWAQLAPLLATLLAIVFLTSALLPAKPKKAKPARFNTLVKLDCDKCVDTCNAVADIEDSGKKVFCRCWKSKTFPYCDGSHVAHNKATGDNLGPLIVTKPAAA